MNTRENNKNPLFAGLINVLIPGASHVYVSRDWGRFAGAFVINVLLLTAAISGGNGIQHARGYSLPQGACVGSLVMTVVIVMFSGGYKVAANWNSSVNAAAFYNSKRHTSLGNAEKQYAEIQKMRDEGLISDLEYDEKNEKVKIRFPHDEPHDEIKRGE